jgi:hypothetical protein
VATVSSLIVFFLLRALGVDADFKLLVIPAGVFAIYIGLSVFG